MANGDIKLDGSTTIVEGNYLLVKCWDIKLDSSDRRSNNSGHRRALVHGFSDELVINYADDYPGGVTIRGEIQIPGKIKQGHLRCESHDLHLDHPDRRTSSSGARRAMVHGFADELVINYGDDYPGGVTIRGEIQIPGKIKQGHLRCESHDLHLDHPDRRISTNGARRALVHGFDDELALNYNKDYPGGTVIHGNLDVKKNGTFRIINSNNDVIAQLDRWGNLALGGGNQDGDIMLKDGNGNEIIRIDTQYNRVDFKNTDGSVQVRIDKDDFTESPWPNLEGESVPSRLDLIKEIRRMKEEIVTLRSQVDTLMAGG